MTEEHTAIIRLLRALEIHLAQGGRHDSAESVGKISRRISAADDLDTVLNSLFAVPGFDGVAVRLMWYAERLREPNPVPEAPGFQDYLAANLAAQLGGHTGRATSPGQGEPAAAELDLAQALARFDACIETVKRSSYKDEVFEEIPLRGLDDIIREVVLLGEAAAAERNVDVLRFTSALSRCVDYVIRQRLFRDVRVLNLIDSANLTLQTALETRSAEDYDSLQQTIKLLEQPAGVLEPPDEDRG